MLIDLQLHSTYSDGYLTPTEAASFIAKQGVKVASLTDHNTVGGLDEFRLACKKHKIKSITGLELYVKLHKRRFNLLWYNFDENSPELHNVLRLSQMRRRYRVRILLNRLVRRGLKLDVNKIIDQYNHYVPVNHIVDDIIAIPFNRRKIKKRLKLKNPREGDVLQEYFHNKDFGVLKNSYIDMDTVVDLHKRIGGQLVICHPAKHHHLSRNFLNDIIDMGVTGIEVLSPHHSYGAVVYLQHLAHELKLTETGGSDFHRVEGGSAPIQYSWQYYKVDSAMLKGIKKIIG